MNLKEFTNLPLMGILRDVDPDIIEPLSETVISSGLNTIEITMNTSSAPRLINKMRKSAGKRLMVGAGTVLTMDDMRSALDSGATFIVMPTLVREIVEYCAKNSIPVFPGAMTPQEIYDAWTAGATMVKVFPVKFLGPGYIKEIKGPFKDIKLLACGGVTNDNIGLFFSSGASAVAFGGSVFKKEWLRRGEFHRIGEAIKELVEGYEEKYKSKK